MNKISFKSFIISIFVSAVSLPAFAAGSSANTSYDSSENYTIGDSYHKFEDWTSSNAGVSSSTSTHTVTFTAGGPAYISFDWSVSSEDTYDYLIVLLDGNEIIKTSGTNSSTYISSALSVGSHTLIFTYTKDSSINSNDDKATVTNFFMSNISSQEGSDKIETTTITDGTFASNTTWYRLKINSKYMYTSGTNIMCNTTTAQYDQTYFWCFTKDDSGYFSIYNMSTGASVPLSTSSYASKTYMQMSSGNTYSAFDLTDNTSGGFNIQVPGTTNPPSCANDYGELGQVAMWCNSRSTSGAGSNVEIEEIGTVSFSGIETITLSETELNLQEKSSATLSYIYTPADATLTNVTWSSSNTKVATVNSSGTVTATGVGDAIIKVAYSTNVYAECTVHVTAIVRVSGITLSASAVKISASEGNKTIGVTVSPDDAYDRTYSVSSSNTDVVMVDKAESGVTLTGVAVGEAVVTVSANDDSGQYAQCSVTVYDPDDGTVVEHGDKYLYLKFLDTSVTESRRDSSLIVIPKDYIRSATYADNRFTAQLTSGNEISYTGVTDTLSAVPYELPSFQSYKFNNKFNYQVFTDVKADDPSASEINLEVGGIGKRLTPSFQLPNDKVKVWVDGKLQDSKHTRMRFDHSIEYTIGYDYWHEIEIRQMTEGTYKVDSIPFGKKTTVTVDWLTDHPSNDYNVPEIYIVTSDGTGITDKTNYKDATFEIKGGGVYPDMASTAMKIKGRGNTSWGGYGSKNPYHVKFSKKQSPLGMTKGKNWILLANKQTSSMTTNAIGHKIASLMDAEYPCHIVPVELYINGTYQGSYNFCEKVKISNNSVDVNDSISAMMELDTYEDEGETPNTQNAYEMNVKINDPDVEEADYEGKLTWQGIFNDFNTMTNVLMEGHNDSSHAADYLNYVDADALVNYLATCELMCNCELKHPKSVFCYSEDVTNSLDPTGKDPTPWKFGPLWDCDWAFGYESSFGYFQVNEADDFFANLIGSSTPKQFWNDLRYQSTVVDSLYYVRWNKFMTEGGIDELVEFCDDYYQYAYKSLEHNSKGQFASDYTDYSTVTSNSKTWLKTRANHIYGSINQYVIKEEEEEAEALLGDANNDGSVDVNDLSAVVGYILNTNVISNFDQSAADVNQDNSIDVNDLSGIVTIILGTDPTNARGNSVAKQSTADTASCEPLNIKPGTDAMLYINIDNGSDIAGFQFDIQLPEGFICESVAVDADRVDANSPVCYAQQSDGSLRVLCYSMSNNSITGNSGPVAAVNIHADANIGTGLYKGMLQNIILASANQGNKVANTPVMITVDTATDIHTVGAETSADGHTYDLNGRLQNNGKIKSGVYISKNKKYILK